MLRAAPLLFVALLTLGLAGCNSPDGDLPDDLGAPPDSLPPVLCGNGKLDPGELCDPALAAGQVGSCPTACPDSSDPCVRFVLSGKLCQTTCQRKEITELKSGDQCCPKGASEAADSDCHTFTADGPELTVCRSNAPYWPPTLATGPQHYAVGCVPNGNQNITPTVNMLDPGGAAQQTYSLLTADGYNYNDMSLTYKDNRFQVVYQYNCNDHGSFEGGWGWGCIDFREYDSVLAHEVTPSLVFGVPGHNGHPVLDFGGDGFGVGWISYDKVYFRKIGSDRKLAPADRTMATLIGQDPYKSDNRDGARTKIAADGSGGYGIFSIIGYRLFYSHLGTPAVTLRELGPGYSSYTDGQFSVVYQGGFYFVAYFDETDVRFLKVSPAGAIVASTKLPLGIYYYPQMFAHQQPGRFVVLTHDKSKQGVATFLDADAAILASKPLLTDRTMQYPAPGYDPVSDRLAIAYLDDTKTVKFQRLILRLPE